MTIFGLSITKKSRNDALETKIYELIGNISSMATEVAALIATHEEYEAEISALKAEIEPMKAFMQEHSKNILEAEEEFNKYQRDYTKHMNELADFNPLVKKQGDK